MNKTDLINAVAEQADLSKKDASNAVDAVFDAITGSLKKSEKVQLIGFGNFEVRERSARKGRMCSRDSSPYTDKGCTACNVMGHLNKDKLLHGYKNVFVFLP